ncbi:hypothetical protein SAMN04490243_0953 [Robiginitalea myxolifaciens]|uniref:Right handed beta helix region n=1 Tax=Robiginitalea myxolifaciens TaxID=400055 RepID=A0A1I6FZ26_9FLAO|nr:hypothetical protein [Robiginitalea myxolifaciens]SFR35198.1 hypothetical protein SAMN04490243_0953 [Robiginitalea myxolifaciens]
MKTNILKFAFFATFFALFLASCSNDDDGPDPEPQATCTDGIQNGDETGVDCGGSCSACVEPENTDLNGSLSEDRTLDPTLTYRLRGTYSIESGATLTIPAGTTIIADTGTDVYFVVQKGGDIAINGTAAAPVLMTSASEAPGDWGGLVIAGNATTTEGVDAIAEVGGIIYGGTDDADSSGSISYLIINYAGAQINSESQYNGLSLYAVGSGTSISNVAILNGTDDGVEFFGGTVSASNFYLENNEDDAVDWTEGWNGELSNTYVLHTIDGFSTAVEADGVNANPTLTNFTAVSTEGGTALQFKKESGATITGLSLTGYETSVEMRDGGPLANVQIDGMAADPANTYLAAATVDIAIFAWVDTDVSVESQDIDGAITADMMLDANVIYRLTGTLSVENGATLTIPAGTTIISDTGTDKYIVVQKGSMIDVQGTMDDPVIMTSSDQTPGDWGGLVIAGNASTTEGIDAIAEVGGIIYGGTDDADNSGSINYLVINYAGAQINSESQYNGLSLYAVGSGTSITNVAILNGTDDGVEFFGGTVSASNFYLENNEDDAVDWTEGWNGTLTKTYVLHTIDGFSTAVEADGVDAAVAVPTLADFTAVSTTGGTALQFKKTTGAVITNIVLDGYATNVEMRDGGPVSNVEVDGTAMTTVDDDVFNGTAVDPADFGWATGN